MEDQNYIVLRSTGRFIPTIDNLGFPGGPVGAARPTAMTLRNEISDIEISEMSLTKGQKDDLRRDPLTRAMAPSMPLNLIAPLAMNNPDQPPVSAAGHVWGIDAVGAGISSFDGSGVTVAVLDTGIDPGHPAFSGVNTVLKNFTSEVDGDVNGHGTHTAGTIFGQDVGGTRIGVARNVSKALIGKVLGAGGGSSATLANAINWAAENGAHVISMSLGIDFPGYVEKLVTEAHLDVRPATSIALEAYRANINLFSALSQTLEARNAFGTGSLVVAASGNESHRPQYEIAVAPPAAGNGIISVGALQQGAGGMSVAAFSNTQCDISAPGVAISSAAMGGGLVSMNGTSMATPHVAGVAALWAQKALEQSGFVSSQNLAARLLGMASREGMAAGAEMDDIGSGIVRAPV